MKRHELSAESFGEGAKVVRRFFACLKDEQGAAAGRLAVEGFRWFGREVSQQDWRGPTFAAYLREQAMSFQEIRPIPMDLLEHLGPLEPLCDGPLGPEHSLFLVDVQRSDAAVTAGVVVGKHKGRARLMRVFEPEALAQALTQLGQKQED